MKGVICYYSATGNTKLVADFVVKKLSWKFDFCNIARDGVPDFSGYDIAGFASPVDWLAEPQLMREFLANLPQVNGKPAFILVSFGGLLGKIISAMKKPLKKKGFIIVAASALRVPDNYPPILSTGRHDNTVAPTKKEMGKFKLFIDSLDGILKDIGAKRPVKEACLGTNLLGAIAGHFGRNRSKRGQGRKFVDEKSCTTCGLCGKGCPYRAITLDPFPRFDEAKCYGCWACYNRCPEKAIYTKKLRGKGQYPGPTEELRNKLAL